MVIALGPALGPALASAQSLGDAARRQAATRERPNPPKARVYTDSDLTSSTPDDPGSTSAEPSSPPPTEHDPAAATDEGSRARGGRRTPKPKVQSEEERVREELKREQEAREALEHFWRAHARAVRQRAREAQWEYDRACGPNALSMAGG